MAGQLESEEMIYLDYNATTPLDGRVRERLLEVVDHLPANAASQQHAAGRAANMVVEESRRRAADSLGISAPQLVWTSGASEAISIAIFGVVASSNPSSRTILLSPTEHKAVIAAAELCVRTLGARIVWLDVDGVGAVQVESLKSKLSNGVCLVAAMHSNNETGIFNPVEEMANMVARTDAEMLVDFTQSIGKVEVGEALRSVNLAVLSAHKFYGPKGVGALLVDPSVKRRLVSLQPGGGQEFGIRGGTHNTAGIAAASLAIELAISELGSDADLAYENVQLLESRLISEVSNVEVVTGTTPRLPNTLNLRFVGADAEAVMANAPDLALSTGSACNSAVPEPSHVLLAMGMSKEAAEECLRFSTGRFTSKSEIESAATMVARSVSRVRQLTAA